MSEEKIVFICGTARSGSTILDLALSNEQNRFGCGELYALFRPWKKHHANIECSCGDSRCTVWRSIKDNGVREEQIHRHLFDNYDCNVLVDSSKNLNWLIDSINWCREKNIQYVIVAVWKFADELSKSFERRGRDDWFEKFCQYHYRLDSLGETYITIKYADLVERTDETLQKLCDVVGVSYVESMDVISVSKSHFLFGSGGVRNGMIDNGRLRIEKRSNSDANLNTSLDEISASKYDDVCSMLIEKDLFRVAPTYSKKSKRRYKPWWYYQRKARDFMTLRVPMLRRK